MKQQYNYFLDLTKEVCIFIMMAYGFQNQAMMESFSPILAMLAVLFMFIPRVLILKGESTVSGTTEWKRNLTGALNIIKFFSLVIMTLYIFWNTWMIETFGLFLLWMMSCFMVVPRKLIYIVATETMKDFERDDY